MSTKLELLDVYKSYDTTHVLNGINLAVNDHEVVCLIGPSGCGKSTILRCVDLLDTIDGGEILLDGENVAAAGIDADAVRRRIGIVFQSYNLFPHLTVLDNTTLGSRRAHGVPKDEAEAKALELLDRFGLADKAGDYPNRMSGGQNQRAAVVRALMSDPELLLLDEVTSALDPELVGEVLSVIRELAGAGMTMVLATHEMGFARDVANQVCFLHEGRVLEAAPPGELFSNPQEERTKQFLKRVTEAPLVSTRIVGDPGELAALFGRDRHLHIYALADLDEPFWSASTWWRNGDAALGRVGLPNGQAIVYAVSSADPAGTLRLTAELVAEIPPTLVTGVSGVADVFTAAGRTLTWQRGYHRFHLVAPDLVPVPGSQVLPLGPDDIDEVSALYATEPHAAFFEPSMLTSETFVGIRVGDQLCAVAGTHVLSEAHDVAAIGAVFTHPAHRGQGFGAAVTAGAVHRIGQRVSTIGLNCTDGNLAARQIYMQMGFEPRLAYQECELSDS